MADGPETIADEPHRVMSGGGARLIGALQPARTLARERLLSHLRCELICRQCGRGEVEVTSLPH